MGNFEGSDVSVGLVVVADQAEPVGADGQRGVLADVPAAVQRGLRQARAGEVVAMRDLEVATRRVVVGK